MEGGKSLTKDELMGLLNDLIECSVCECPDCATRRRRVLDEFDSRKQEATSLSEQLDMMTKAYQDIKLKAGVFEQVLESFREFDSAAWSRVEQGLERLQFGVTWGGLRKIRNYLVKGG